MIINFPLTISKFVERLIYNIYTLTKGVLQMIIEKELKLDFKDKGTGIFNLENINEDIIDKIMFLGDNTYKELLEFVQFNNIKNVFYKYYYKDIEDYIVDIEDIDEDIQVKVEKRVIQHNKDIKNIDLNKPTLLLVICKFEGDVYGASLNDDWYLEYSDMESDAFIEKIEDEFSGLLDEKENAMKEIKYQEIEEKRLQLESIIINDDNFKACTNKALRRNYIVEFLDKNESKEFYSILIRDSYGREDRTPAYLLIEVLWNKYRLSLKA